MSGLTREHFKESFDAIFEHLANGGEGGKVSKYTIMCLFVVKVSKYTVWSEGQQIHSCMYLERRSANALLDVCLERRSAKNHSCQSVVQVSKYTLVCMPVWSEGQQIHSCVSVVQVSKIHSCLYVCFE